MRRRFALIIGNTEYKDKRLRQLAAPWDDAHDFAEILVDSNVGRFDEVQLLINESAEKVRIKIAELYANKDRDDLLLLYFSGHGWLDSIKGLFLTTQDSNIDLVGATAVGANFISQEMKGSVANRKVVILDCCHSGAFFDGYKGVEKSVGTDKEFLDKDNEGYGSIVITATDSVQYAFQGNILKSETKYSAFTHYLIEGIRSGQADIDKNGIITTDEIYNYVLKKLRENNPNQLPRIFKHNLIGDVIIAYNPISGYGVLSEQQLYTIVSPDPEIREGSVKMLRRLFFEQQSLGNSDGVDVILEKLHLLSRDEVQEVAGLGKIALDDCEQRLQIYRFERGSEIAVQRLSATKKIQAETLVTDTSENRTHSLPLDAICMHCEAPRSSNLKVPCPLCGSKQYVFGYLYPSDARIISNPILLIAKLFSRITQG